MNLKDTITKLEKELFELKKENHKLLQYKEAIEEGNMVTIGDLKGNIKYVNEKFCECTLYTKEEVIGKPHSILRGEKSKEIFTKLWETIKSKKTWHGILRNKRKNGDYYYINSMIKPILDHDGEILEYIAIRHEITDLVEKTEKLEKSLREDRLTNLGNRFKLLEDIKNSNQPSLALMDISSFGDINDFYGYDIGDKVLKITAKFIEGMVPKNYLVYRIYSDQFAILVDNENREKFVEVIKNISSNISSQPILVMKKEIYLQIRYSISFENKEKIKKTANMIKRYSKVNKDITIYDKNLGIESIYENNILWTLKLKKALENDNILPYYQPIYNLKTNKIEKYEALARLKDENGDIISPFYFLDIAKKSKQYVRLTRKMIKKSIEYFIDKDYEFSINLTIEDIEKKEVSEFILEKLKEYNIASKVVFELVESEGIKNFEEVNDFFDKVKQLGCKIAIDDFGSGYSNFDYLIKLNADYIKIDGSLIKDIVVNKNNQEIVITIIDFAKRQGFKTIAEFVSTEEIFNKVKQLGVDYVQGYYIGEPKDSIE